MHEFNIETRRSLIAALQAYIETNDARLIRDAVAQARAGVGHGSSPVSLLRAFHDLIEEVPAVSNSPVEGRSLIVARLIEACVSAYYPPL